MTHLLVQSRNDSEHEVHLRLILFATLVNHALIAIAQEAELLKQAYPVQADALIIWSQQPGSTLVKAL